MQTKYVIGGIFSLLLGIYIIIRQIKTIRAGKQDSLGFDYKLLIAGGGFFMLGIGMIFQNI